MTRNMKIGEMFGWWYNEEEDLIYIDRCISINILSMAVFFGKNNKQIAIWDWAKSEEITL